MSCQKIVAIGGGTGLPMVLKGLKKYTDDLTAIVSVGDDGGSSGCLRRELGILPPGDIRNCIIALLDDSPGSRYNCGQLEQLLNYRFPGDNGLSGHAIGNLLLAALTDINNSFEQAIDILSDYFAVKGKVFPVSLDDIILCAELVDGQIIEGQCKISARHGPVKRIYVKQGKVEALPAVIDKLKEADVIIMGPGSLYTSVIPNLLVKNVADTIAKSRAIKIFVSNVMTQPGETDSYTAEDHVEHLLDYFSDRKVLDYVIVNNKEISKEKLHLYLSQDSKFVTINRSADIAADKSYTVVCRDLIMENDCVRHDPDKLAKVIMEIIKQNKRQDNGDTGWSS